MIKTEREQGWELALSLICSLLFRPKSLILKSDRERFALVALLKEQLWANRSLKKSDHEQIALVVLYKRVTLRESL